MQKNSTSFYLLLSLFFLFFSLSANIKLVLPILKISKQEAASNFKPEFTRIFSIGQKRLLSSLLWSKTLLESDVDHYKVRDLNSWLFLRFQLLITLDPNFYDAYLYGGQYLSVIKDDLEGATYIFEKGLEKFPNDYKLLYHAGFHYYTEIKDLSRAKNVYQRLLKQPDILSKFPLAPKILARIEEKNNNRDAVLEILNDTYERLPDEHFLKKVYEAAIKKILERGP